VLCNKEADVTFLFSSL